MSYAQASGPAPVVPTATGTAATGQIPGTTTNDNAAAGKVGEVITANVVVGSAIPLTTATAANVTSISLTAGDWELSGCVGFTQGATTTVSIMFGGVSATSATLAGLGTYWQAGSGITAAGDLISSFPTNRVSLAGTTTIFLVARGDFATNTLSAYGLIRGRRVR
jgi:hypothetical protein